MFPRFLQAVREAIPTVAELSLRNSHSNCSVLKVLMKIQYQCVFPASPYSSRAPVKDCFAAPVMRLHINSNLLGVALNPWLLPLCTTLSPALIHMMLRVNKYSVHAPHLTEASSPTSCLMYTLYTVHIHTNIQSMNGWCEQVPGQTESVCVEVRYCLFCSSRFSGSSTIQKHNV